jgi:hypothetical protein
MGWRGGWPERVPRPKAAKLEPERLETLASRARAFVEESPVLRELVEAVQLARGRIYFWRGDQDLLARITPLSERTFLLERETARGGWSEEGRGPFHLQLRAIEEDADGSMHGLGALAPARGRKKKVKGASVPARLHREFGVPLRVAAEPRDWYAKRRTPVIIETAPDRVLVKFNSVGPFGAFGGTCLYARRNGEWNCYYVRPNRSESIATAEAWLAKKNWLEDDAT